MGLIGVPPERYWMKDGVYLPKDELPPAAYVGKCRFQEICQGMYTCVRLSKRIDCTCRDRVANGVRVIVHV